MEGTAFTAINAIGNQGRNCVEKANKKLPQNPLAFLFWGERRSDGYDYQILTE